LGQVRAATGSCGRRRARRLHQCGLTGLLALFFCLEGAACCAPTVQRQSNGGLSLFPAPGGGADWQNRGISAIIRAIAWTDGERIGGSIDEEIRRLRVVTTGGQGAIAVESLDRRFVAGGGFAVANRSHGEVRIVPVSGYAHSHVDPDPGANRRAHGDEPRNPDARANHSGHCCGHRRGRGDRDECAHGGTNDRTNGSPNHADGDTGSANTGIANCDPHAPGHGTGGRGGSGHRARCRDTG
jgi:hypothetical protein